MCKYIMLIEAGGKYGYVYTYVSLCVANIGKVCVCVCVFVCAYGIYIMSMCE